MKKCEVLVERISLTVNKGSVVIVDDKQFEVAKKFLKPLDIREPKKVEEVETREDKEEVEEEIKTTKKSKKK